VAHFAHWFVFYQPKERDWQVTEGLGVRQLAAAFFGRSVGSASLLATTFSDTIAHFQLRNAETTAASWPYPVRLGWKAAASCRTPKGALCRASGLMVADLVGYEGAEVFATTTIHFSGCCSFRQCFALLFRSGKSSGAP